MELDIVEGKLTPKAVSVFLPELGIFAVLKDSEITFASMDAPIKLEEFKSDNIWRFKKSGGNNERRL